MEVNRHPCLRVVAVRVVRVKSLMRALCVLLVRSELDVTSHLLVSASGRVGGIRVSCE